MAQGIFKGLVYVGRESMELQKTSMQGDKKIWHKNADGTKVIESVLCKVKLQNPKVEGQTIHEFYFIEWHERNDMINQEMKMLIESIQMYSEVDVVFELKTRNIKGKQSNHFSIVGIYPAKEEGEKKQGE